MPSGRREAARRCSVFARSVALSPPNAALVNCTKRWAYTGGGLHEMSPDTIGSNMKFSSRFRGVYLSVTEYRQGKRTIIGVRCLS
eukprot:scaffold13234_cov36-Tisochrysis_lutea.AAC.2